MDDPDLVELRELAQRITDDDRVRLTPPPEVWAGIEAATDAVAARAESIGAHEEDDAALDEIRTVEDPVVLDRHRLRTAPTMRRRRRRHVAMAAMAAAIAGVLGFSLITSDAPDRIARAEATNSGLPEDYRGSAIAVAEVVDDQRRLVVDLDSELPAGDPIEVWLITADLSEMTSLGRIEGDASFVIPPGIDVAEYSIVDLSIEPDDGDPTHSGRSILRGELLPI